MIVCNVWIGTYLPIPMQCWEILSATEKNTCCARLGVVAPTSVISSSDPLNGQLKAVGVKRKWEFSIGDRNVWMQHQWILQEMPKRQESWQTFRKGSVIRCNQQIAACKKGLLWREASRLLQSIPAMTLQAAFQGNVDCFIDPNVSTENMSYTVNMPQYWQCFCWESLRFSCGNLPEICIGIWRFVFGCVCIFGLSCVGYYCWIYILLLPMLFI